MGPFDLILRKKNTSRHRVGRDVVLVRGGGHVRRHAQAAADSAMVGASKCAEIELKSQGGVYLEGVGYLIEGVVVLSDGIIYLAIVGI